ncbi:MAG: hypothetical protein K1X64_00830 [Myxococcaceae bacterium]|nr:hypothetical protein [Myxococcaceae bacterium]
MQLNAVLAELKGVKGVARADPAGNVQEVAGQVDGETTCAVAVMCIPQLEGGGGLLQLGSVQGFAIISEKSSMVLMRTKAGVMVAMADAKVAPDNVLRRLATLGGR